jgi:hypothetical protein
MVTRRSLSWTTLATLACVLLLTTAPALASDGVGSKKQAKPAIQFVGDKDIESSFTWQQLLDGTARIEVWNNSDCDRQVTVAFSPLVLLNATPDLLANSPITATIVATKPQPVKAHESASFQLKIDSHAVPHFSGSGNYGGLITISSDQPESAPIRRKFQISIPPAHPGISKATFFAKRDYPFRPFISAEGRVPLSGNTELGDHPRVIGYVQGLAGSSAVRWTRNEVPQGHPEETNAVLEFMDLPGAGSYDGQINFSHRDAKESEMSITIVARDAWGWPVLMIAIGIGSAYLAKRYLGVLRPTWTLRAQEAALGPAFVSSQAAFARAASGTSVAGFSIEADLESSRIDIRAVLSELEALPATSIMENPMYTSTGARLKQLSDTVGKWPRMAIAAVALQQASIEAYKTIDRDATIPRGEYKDSDPELFVTLSNTLSGRPISCADVANRLQEFQASLSLVDQWKQANLKIIDLSRVLQTLRSSSDSDDVKQIKVDLSSIWIDLWRADREEDLKNVSDALVNEEKAINGFIVKNKEPSAGEGYKAAFAAKQQLLEAKTVAAARKGAVATAPVKHEPNHFLLFIKGGDTASVGFAFLIALLTGLNVNYLGKPWGTFQDYVTMFLWAAGTKVGLDIVAAITDRFFSVLPSRPS